MRRRPLILGLLIAFGALVAYIFYSYSGSRPTYMDVVVPNGFRGFFIIVTKDADGVVRPSANGSWVLPGTGILRTDLSWPAVRSAQFADGSAIAAPGQEPENPEAIVCRGVMASNSSPATDQRVITYWYWVGPYADWPSAMKEARDSNRNLHELRLGEVRPGDSP